MVGIAGSAPSRDVSGGPDPAGLQTLQLRPTAIVDCIDLTDTTQGYTNWVRVPRGKTLFSVTIEVTSGHTWSSGTIVEPQWALIPTDIDHGFAVTYDPAIQLTSAQQSRPGIAALARGWVRLKTTAATSGDDPAAKTIIDFF